MTPRWTLALLCGAALLLYWPVVSYGLWFDDYMDLRPLGWDEAWAALTGPWGVVGFQDVYHRPFATLLLGGLFAIFGLWPPGFHAVSLAALMGILVLLHRWVRLEAGDRVAAVVCAIYILHPALGRSTVVWISNLKNAAAVLLVLATLLLWRRARRSTTWAAWWPCLAAGTLGVWFREDTGVILPAVFLLQWHRARVHRDVPAPTWWLVWRMGAVVLAVAALRWAILPEVDAIYWALTREDSWRARLWDIVYVPLRTMVLMAHRNAVAWPETIVAVVLCGSAARAAIRDAGSTVGRFAGAALILAVTFSVPNLLAPDATVLRGHLMTLAAALVWGAGLVALWDRHIAWIARPPIRRAIVVLLAVLTLAHAVRLQQRMNDRYAPCNIEMIGDDVDVVAWPTWVVPIELHDFLTAKLQWCEGGQVGPPPTLPITLTYTARPPSLLPAEDEERAVGGDHRRQ